MARMRRLLLLTACLLCVSAAATAQTTTLPADLTAKIDAAVADALKSTGAPSASIAVVKDGQLAYAHAYGLARVETKTAATAAMRYSIGSVSKQFAASAILLLAEEGKLSLDDPVTTYLADAPQTWNGVTVRHLLTHTSGLVRDTPDLQMKSQTVIDAIRGAYVVPLAFAPGEKFLYSNIGYFTLAEIIKIVRAHV